MVMIAGEDEVRVTWIGRCTKNGNVTQRRWNVSQKNETNCKETDGKERKERMSQHVIVILFWEEEMDEGGNSTGKGKGNQITSRSELPCCRHNHNRKT